MKVNLIELEAIHLQLTGTEKESNFMKVAKNNTKECFVKVNDVEKE